MSLFLAIVQSIASINCEDADRSFSEPKDTGKVWFLSDADRSTVRVTSSNGGISLQLPETAPDSIATVIAIEM